VAVDPFFPRFGGESCHLSRWVSPESPRPEIVSAAAENAADRGLGVVVETIIKTFRGAEDCHEYWWRFWGMHSRAPLQGALMHNLTEDALRQGLAVGDAFRLQAWDPFAEVPAGSEPPPGAAILVKETRKAIHLSFRCDVPNNSPWPSLSRADLACPTPALSPLLCFALLCCCH